MSDEPAVIIGGGQAGLALARCLQRRGVRPVVLDAAARVGDAWRNRYDSLTLFTPSQYDSLPDSPFPLPPDQYPTKDIVADYLEQYARDHRIDVRGGTRVESLRYDRRAQRFCIDVGTGTDIGARSVAVATGCQQLPAIPAFAAHLPEQITQMHTSEYRNPASLPAGLVLVVGAGNSGAQIAEELAPVRDTTISYERLPKRFPQRLLGKDIFFWFIRVGVMRKADDRQAGSAAVVGAVPLIGSRVPKLLRSGALRRRPRAVGATRTGIAFADGTTLDPDVVIWATGFRNDFSWIDIETAVDGHEPVHRHGIADPPGLHFIGLPGLASKGSGFLGWVGEDAERLATVIAERLATQT